MRCGRILAVAVFCLAVPTTRAGSLAIYTFAGLPGNEASVPADPRPPGATLAPITRGPGLRPNAGANSINSRDWTGGTVAAPADYYQFTVTPAPGRALHLQSLEFTDRRSATGPDDVEVRFSTDGFASSRLVARYSIGDTANHREILRLAGFPLLADLTKATTFRISAFDATTSAGTYRLGVDVGSAGRTLSAELILTTTTITTAAVPEPGGILLLGIGLAVAVLLSRRPGLRRRQIPHVPTAAGR